MALHTRKYQLEERRKQIASMLAQSMTEREIADKLGVDQSTVSRDIKALKQLSQKFVYDLAKSDLAFYYKQCMDTIQVAERMIWETYRNREHFNEAERKERYQVAKMIIDSVQARFPMFKDGPIIMTVKALEDRLAHIEFRKENQELSR